MPSIRVEGKGKERKKKKTHLRKEVKTAQMGNKAAARKKKHTGHRNQVDT